MGKIANIGEDTKRNDSPYGEVSHFKIHSGLICGFFIGVLVSELIQWHSENKKRKKQKEVMPNVYQQELLLCDT